MSFSLASGPKSQFLAWTAVAGVGVAAYITVKKRTNEKKRLDMQKKLAAQASAEAGPSTPIAYRGGVGISTASGAYQAAMQNKHTSTSTATEAHFLPKAHSSSFTSAMSTGLNELGFSPLADYRKTDSPMSLREYREQMALMDRNME